MIELLDYIQDMDDNFWIINNITAGTAKGYIVYRVCDNGNRFNHLTKKNYLKDNDNLGIIEIPKNYKKIFKPREFYKDNKNNLSGIWKEYVEALNEIGIDDNDIGIFGSYLVGFDITKDVDFVIYGKENLYKYHKNINYIRNKLNVTSITPEHANYQYNKHKVKFPSQCDLKEIVKRNWSGIELSNGVLSTPRFIDLNNMSIPKKKGEDRVVTINVLEGIETAMLPRIAKVMYNDEEYKVMSPIWKFQSFAHPGDVIEIYGNVNEEEKTIILDNHNYYIKYLEKYESII